jgi:hypothetical protein
VRGIPCPTTFHFLTETRCQVLKYVYIRLYLFHNIEGPLLNSQLGALRLNYTVKIFMFINFGSTRASTKMTDCDIVKITN